MSRRVHVVAQDVTMQISFFMVVAKKAQQKAFKAYLVELFVEDTNLWACRL